MKKGIGSPQCMFNPHDVSLITCCGSHIFKSFRVAESNLKPLAPMLGKRDPQVPPLACSNALRQSYLSALSSSVYPGCHGS